MFQNPVKVNNSDRSINRAGSGSSLNAGDTRWIYPFAFGRQSNYEQNGTIMPVSLHEKAALPAEGKAACKSHRDTLFAFTDQFFDIQSQSYFMGIEDIECY